MEIEVQKAKLESNHLVEHVELDKANGNPKLVVTPTDGHARWQLKKKDWSDYTIYVEIE
jgi:hypothetical protein